METLCFRWEDFADHMKQGFSQLQADEDFHDVTLACGENHINAHRIILSTSSPVLKSLLKSLSHSHPLLYLKDINFRTLKSLIGFMYNGEVYLEQDELHDFIALAKELQVKGLLNAGEEGPKVPHPRESLKEGGPYHEDEKDTNAQESSLQEDESFYPSFTPKEGHISDVEIEEDGIGLDGSMTDNSSTFLGDDYDEQIDAEILKMMTSSDANMEFRCLKCPHICHRKRDMMNHVEARHMNLDKFPCHICNKRYSTRVILKKHLRTAHNIRSKTSFFRPHPTQNTEPFESISFEEEENSVSSIQEFDEEGYDSFHSDELLDSKIMKLMVAKESTNMFHCLKCSHACNRKRDMMNHIEAKHMDLDKFPCDICKKGYNTRSLLKRHMAAMHKESPTQGRACQSVSDLEDPIGLEEVPEFEDVPEIAAEGSSRGEGEVNLLSNSGNYDDALDAEILKHMISFQDGTQFRCLKCSHTCHRKRDMMNHIEGRHLLLDRFPCPICQAQTKTRVSLKKHLRASHMIFQNEAHTQNTEAF